MKPDESHLSDSELIAAIDGELRQENKLRAETHLAACWTCRTRRQELESAIGDFVRVHRNLDSQILPSEGPRALFRARMAQARAAEGRAAPPSQPFRNWTWRNSWALVGALCILGGALYLAFETRSLRRPEELVAITAPDPSLTPGATVLLSRRELCSESNTKNKAVSISLQRKIFEEYGIHTRKASAYEVDYLITPALGGADDIHNLWPQSRSATDWNAAVKDALEDHLRAMVCDGQIDLAVAQHEMAADWIQAYKKYFHTDRPLNRNR